MAVSPEFDERPWRLWTHVGTALAEHRTPTPDGAISLRSRRHRTSTPNSETQLMPPTAFVSYSWDDPSHREWVRLFADDLMRNGVATTLDQYDVDIGDDRFRFMETAVRESDHVIVVCTPEYVRCANERQGGVGVETAPITPGVYTQNSQKRFIPIIRRRDKDTAATPDFLASLFDPDFCDDSHYEQKMEQLLRSIHRQPCHPKPILGPVPYFGAQQLAEVTRLASLLRRSPRSFDFLRSVAAFTLTDDEFHDLITKNPDLFQAARIKRRDEHGQRQVPGRPGVQCLKKGQGSQRSAGSVSLSGYSPATAERGLAETLLSKVVRDAAARRAGKMLQLVPARTKPATVVPAGRVEMWSSRVVTLSSAIPSGQRFVSAA